MPNRFITFIKNHRKLSLIVGPVLLVVILGSVIWLVSKNYTKNDEPVNHVTNSDATKYYSLLNGTEVSESTYNQRVVATMIENSPDARPQAGLINADVVYEATVEGGITRFMAQFQTNQPSKVGPVRSARSYYIDWLSEVDAIYMHAGGSPTALSRISSYGIKDYPHASNDSYWREPKAGVASEHTLYANVAKVFDYATSKNNWSATNTFDSWKFKDAATPTTTGTVSVNFTTANYKVDWEFDSVNNTYLRKMAGTAHKDQVSGEQISAKTVVVMTVQRSANAAYSTGKESEWSMTTIGSGAASVFVDGTRVDGTWKKDDRTSRTRFYDASGAEIPLNRGKIWVEVIPQTGTVSFTPTAITPVATQ